MLLLVFFLFLITGVVDLEKMMSFLDDQEKLKKTWDISQKKTHKIHTIMGRVTCCCDLVERIKLFSFHKARWWCYFFILLY